MVKKTVRDQVYSLKTYLKYVKDGDICENADVQRLAGNFDNKEVNELVYTVLTSDHIPELILAECNEDNQTYITDGLQRTTMLRLFRYGNYKITSSIDDSVVEYMRKKRDDNGNIIKNERGQVEFEEAEFNIKNKTYDMLPDELKKEFDDYQIHIVIHEDCTMKRISDLIKRYNYQRAMTVAQRAFTYMDNFAVKAREISNRKFFIECAGYKETEKINGTIERVIAESVMCMFHFNDWKRASKDVCSYLNKKSTEEEFEEFGNKIKRLENIITPDFNSIFTSKNSFIWFKLFDDFTKLNFDDVYFADFIKEFNEKLKNKVVDEITYKDIDDVTYAKLDKKSGTKDKVLINAKLNILKILMHEYLHNIDKKEENELNILEFVKENVNQNVTQDEICFYEEDFELLKLKVNNKTPLMDKKNLPSMLAIIAYSYKKDIRLDDWMVSYFGHNNSYIRDQKQNYLLMKEDLDGFSYNPTRSLA